MEKIKKAQVSHVYIKMAQERLRHLMHKEAQLIQGHYYHNDTVIPDAPSLVHLVSTVSSLTNVQMLATFLPLYAAFHQHLPFAWAYGFNALLLGVGASSLVTQKTQILHNSPHSICNSRSTLLQSFACGWLSTHCTDLPWQNDHGTAICKTHFRLSKKSNWSREDTECTISFVPSR
jgi:hypothetical protein